MAELKKAKEHLGGEDRLTGFRYAGKLSKADRKTLEATLARQKKLTASDLR